MVSSGVRVDDWYEETFRLLTLVEAAFGVALRGVPASAPAEVELRHHGTRVSFESKDHLERIECEITDAFFIRLKSVFEAQIKRLVPKPDWSKPIQSLGDALGRRVVLDPEDVERVGQMCALRNVISHNDGRVDERAKRRGLTGPDVWLTPEQWYEWLGLCLRVIEAVRKAPQNQT